MIRWQLFEPRLDGDYLTYTEYNSTFTMHGTTMIFMAAMPIIFGFANYLIPLQLGARDLAFPRLNALSYWLLPTGGIVIYMGYFTGGAGDVGWTGYTPYSSGDTATTPGTDFWVAGQIMLGASSTLTAINFLTTMLRMRAPGVTLMRMPLTVWGIFTATVLAMLAFPALLVSAIMMTLDKILGTSFFMPTILKAGEVLEYGGGSPILFQHLFWFFGHPEVYIVALPAFGIVSDLISVHSRKNIFGYRMMVWAIVGIGALSFFVWAHHMYVSGMNPWFGFFFATTTLIIAVPTAMKVYNWILTLWRGNIRLNTVMLWCLGFIVTFVNGGITGIFLGNVSVDVPLSDTYFVIAHFHMVMGIAPLMVIMGAVYHWFPLVSGKFLDEKLGKWHFWLTFLGAYSIYFPMHYLGFIGVPRRYFEMYDSPYMTSAVGMNEFISMAAFIVGAAQFILIYNIIKTLKVGKKAGHNPWKANSLEWLTSTVPPEHGNFGERLPVVHRWPYDFSVPGAKDDFIPQTTPPSEVVHTEVEKT